MGRYRTEDPDRVNTTVRLPRVLHEQIHQEAAARGVGVSWLIARLLSEGMERLIPVEELRFTRPPRLSGEDNPQ